VQKNVPFNIAIESRYPEQIAVCIARDSEGRYNPMTLGWFMPASMSPPMLAIAVGKQRHTLEALRHSRTFVVSFLAEPQSGLARYFGTHTGRDENKFDAVQCRTQPADRIDNLIIEDAVANFECEVVREVDSGDHIVFIGCVICSHITDNPANRMFTLTNSEYLHGAKQRPG